MIVSLERHAKLVVIYSEITFLIARDGLRHGFHRFLGGHADIEFLAAIISEAIKAHPVRKPAKKDNVMLYPEVGPPPSAATTAATAEAATTASPAASEAPPTTPAVDRGHTASSTTRAGSPRVSAGPPSVESRCSGSLTDFCRQLRWSLGKRLPRGCTRCTAGRTCQSCTTRFRSTAELFPTCREVPLIGAPELIVETSVRVRHTLTVGDIVLPSPIGDVGTIPSIIAIDVDIDLVSTQLAMPHRIPPAMIPAPHQIPGPATYPGGYQ